MNKQMKKSNCNTKTKLIIITLPQGSITFKLKANKELEKESKEVA